jgi:hypothetical protein
MLTNVHVSLHQGPPVKGQLIVKNEKIKNHPLIYTNIPDPPSEPGQVLIKIVA